MSVHGLDVAGDEQQVPSLRHHTHRRSPQFGRRHSALHHGGEAS